MRGIAPTARFIARCAPWCPAYFCEGYRESGFTGRYCDDTESIVITCYVPLARVGDARNLGHALTSRLTHHEVWHASHDYLSADALAAVDAMTARGCDRPGAYFSHSDEKRARLFENFAAALDEGLACKYSSDDIGLRVLLAIYNGDLAREVMASKKPARPSFWRRALGLAT